MMSDLIDRVFDEFNTRMDALIRSRDWPSARALCSSHLEKAERATDSEAAAIFASWLASILAWEGRHDDALAYQERAERHVPLDVFRKILIARQLTSELQRPEDGLAKLAEAEPLLKNDERRAWLNEKGLALLALGREMEAVECFRKLTSPDRLATMRQFNYLGLVDFRLVGELVKRGLAREQCVAYLEAAEVVGAAKAGPVDRRTLHDLLAQVREAGA